MATKKNPARQLWKEFFALPARERLLAIVAIVGFLFLVVDFAWVRPRTAQVKDVQAQLDSTRKESEALTQVVTEATKPLPASVTASKLAERDRLRVTVERAESVLHEASGDVRMGEMIRTLASTAPGITLVSLRTLPPQVFYTPAMAPAAAPAKGASAAASASAASAAPAVAPFPPVYRHGLEVTLKGTYASLVPYLRTLETNIPGVYWGGAKLSVGTYPEASIQVTLYTLSTQQELSFE
ncbi:MULTISPECIES: hypothetical protein [Ramlibacter]|uniref:MSHA biogenesis protein MshJ n=1 Tax=Ramlibacter aquaticus TaxID=2780094 RepID=A0ABR9SK36_9BURK|nr:MULTISPECIES: hypothetical protein [Ramlibacter]MBE7942728.1 hypothetical protein [Ramlibacter aquaticus]